MENLSIEQLADLRIAIKENQGILDKNEARNKELVWLNSNLIETNRRLEQEIGLQDTRITEAKAENEALREEKEWILSKFAEDNEKAYKELREKEEKIAWDTNQNALRLIEIEKRESKLVNKENSNKTILNEVKSIQKETKQETIRAEETMINVEAQRKKLKLEQAKINEKVSALKEIEKWLNEKRLEINEKELGTLESIQKNQNLVAELQNKEKANVIQIERLEKLNALFSELKGYVTTNANVTIGEIESLIAEGLVDGEVVDWLEEVSDIINDEKVSNFDINIATYAEMLAEAKKRGIKFEKQPNKTTLIEALA